MQSIAVIGAGVTGLTAAFMLKQKGHRVRVFERQGRAGGMIRSERTDGFLVEQGPQSLLDKGPALQTFLKDLGLARKRIEPNPAAANRYIVKGGELKPLPTSPRTFLTNNLFSVRGKLRLLMEPLIPSQQDDEIEESLAEFVERRLGREVLNYAVDPFVSGIFAGDAEYLSARHSFPGLVNMEREYGSLFKGRIQRKKEAAAKPRLFSLSDGVGEIPAALAAALRDELSLNARVAQVSFGKRWQVAWENEGDRIIETFDQILVCTPAHSLPAISGATGSDIDARPLGELPYTPVSVLALGFRRSHVLHPLDGFGALVPSHEKLPMLGIGFASSLFSDRAPKDHALLYVYVGGARQPALAAKPTAEILRSVAPHLESLLGIIGRPVFTRHTYLEKGIPQYNLGHDRFLAFLKTTEETNPGLYFAGNYRNGISVGECISSGIEAATRIGQIHA